MSIDFSKLQSAYREMSDAEFRRLHRKDLVAGARPIYDSERKCRGIPPPEIVWPERPKASDILREGQRDVPRAIARFLLITSIFFVLVCFFRSAIALFGMGFALAFVLSAPSKPARLILWLRRFHSKQQRKLGLQDLLAHACAGWGFVLTLRDSTFKRSFGAALHQAFKSAFGVLFLTPILFFLAIAAVLPFYDGGDYKNGVVSLVLCLVLSLALGIVSYVRNKNVNLTGPQAMRKAVKALRRFEGRGLDASSYFLESIDILSCDDPNWQEVVNACLAVVSAVVIDVTEQTANISWELQTAFRLLPPESVVLAYGHQGAAGQLLPDYVSMYLSRCLPPADLRRASVCVYSTARGKRSENERYMKLALAAAIAERQYQTAIKAIQDSLL
ncbi:MAG: hypothetical protein WA294_11090 [Acidobacteriaceae bacterium]